jgi:hypothetical protein
MRPSANGYDSSLAMCQLFQIGRTRPRMPRTVSATKRAGPAAYSSFHSFPTILTPAGSSQGGVQIEGRLKFDGFVERRQPRINCRAL